MIKKVYQYKTGNTLSYSEYGDDKGYPVLIQHGLIASITDHHLFKTLIDSGVRIVCIARPGYGESSPYSIENIGEWGEIVSGLVSELGFSEFDLLGMSSGAPYSYSIAYRLPDKVKNIFIFSGIPALYDNKVLACWPYAIEKDADISQLEKLARDLFFSNLSAEAMMQSDVQDSMSHHCFGIALDFKIRIKSWGFVLPDVKTKVYMQHSKSDHQVPFVSAEMTSNLLPNCRLEARESGEHFSAELLDSFLKKTVLEHCGRVSSKVYTHAS